MSYLLRFLLLILGVVCIIGARRVSRAQVSQSEPAATQMVPTHYLSQAAK